MRTAVLITVALFVAYLVGAALWCRALVMR